MARVSLVAVSIALVVSWNSSVHAQAPFTVEWTSGRLTILAADAPLGDVLADVARRTGVTFVGQEHVSGTLTADIREALLFDALRTLLDGRTFIMTMPPVIGDTAAGVVVLLEAPQLKATPVDAYQPNPDVGVGQRYERNPAETEVNRLEAAGFFAPNAPESALLAAATAPDPRVRVRALQTLGIQNSETGARAITHALDDENPFVRAEALDVLVSLGGGADAVRRLGELLDHKDSSVRFSATLLLGEQSGDESEFQLKRALATDDVAGIRDMAAQLLLSKKKDKDK